VPNENGDASAEISMKLDNDLEPLPVDSTFLVRPRSALGLEYVELTPGQAGAGFPAGAVVPLRQARPRPVEIDEVLNTFDQATRTGAQRSLNGFGEGFAGRGEALNQAIEDLGPLVEDLEPVARNLAAPDTRLDRIFRELGDAAAEVAPVAEQQASLFVNLDATFASLATVARPFIQESISESPPTFATGAAEFPKQRPFLRNTTAFARELRPGIRTLPASAPVLADALEFGTDTLPRTPPFNRALADVFDSLAEFAEDPRVPIGVRRLRETVQSLRPTIDFLTPAQTVCNYVTLWCSPRATRTAPTSASSSSRRRWAPTTRAARPARPPTGPVRTTTSTRTRTRTRRPPGRRGSARPGTSPT
jgi:ABC-type transporter Mla subunit MlaD